MIEECDRALSEQELKEKKEAQSKALASARLKECAIIVKIDSIRSRSTLGIPTPPPDTDTPPKFPNPTNKSNHSTTSTIESTIKSSTTETSSTNQPAAEATTATATSSAALAGTKDAPLEIDVIPEPFVIANKKVDSTAAVATLWTAVYTCFVKAPSKFVHQHMYNAKVNKMATFSATKNLERHANETAEILVTDGGPSGKVALFATSIANRKETEAVKRKAQASDDDLRGQLHELQQESKKMKRELGQEKNKRIKLEAQLKKQKAYPPLDPKESGGPAKGADKKNQTGKPQIQPKGPPNRRDKKTTGRENNVQRKADDANTEASAGNGKQHKQRNRKYFQTKKNKTWRKPSAN